MDTSINEGDGSPSRAGPEGTPATDSIVLEEEIDPNYVPSDEEGMAELLALAHRGKGAFWIGMILVSAVFSLFGYLSQGWINK